MDSLQSVIPQLFSSDMHLHVHVCDYVVAFWLVYVKRRTITPEQQYKRDGNTRTFQNVPNPDGGCAEHNLGLREHLLYR
jgi:hypothetical protein